MASPIKEIVCPNCGKPYLYETQRWKAEVVCGNCHTAFTVDDSSSMLPPAAIDPGPEVIPATHQAQMPFDTAGPLPPHLANSGMAVDPLAPVSAQPSVPDYEVPSAAAPAASHVAPDTASFSPAAVGTPTVDRQRTSTALDRLASRPGSNLNGIIAGVLILVLLLVVVAFAVRTGVLMMSDAGDGAGDGAGNKSGPGQKGNGDGIKWAEAPKEASKVQNMHIRIPLVQYGEIRGKDATKQVLTSSGSSYLQIFIELRNRGVSGAPYVSWYGNEFPVGEETRVAKLVDQDGVAIDMMIFDDVASVQGHTARASLNANERMEDVLIFELPNGRDLSSIKALYLTLPGQAFDANGTAHFKIPRSIIRTLSERTDSGLIGSPLDGGGQPEKDE